MLYYVLKAFQFFRRKPEVYGTVEEKSCPKSWCLVPRHLTLPSKTDLRIPLNVSKKFKFTHNKSSNFVIFYPSVYSKNIEKIVPLLTLNYNTFVCGENSDLKYTLLSLSSVQSVSVVKKFFETNSILLCPPKRLH